MMETGKTEIYKNAFPNVLKSHRKLAKLTQEQLAERANIAVRFVQHLEAGKNQPTISTFCELAYALNTSPDKFMFELVKALPDNK
ncbi:MAG: helix-turn-helix transcriptional regulator [Alphaproteobacteria bacterium]|uniref:Transcriptional regulator n=1 Tax=OCS116 cluster bacterium TaxID=2030921 RepID=A0A2A4YZF7_9PROT|nr:helix-turn-helix transcriptional regulator [Alphaproteobacteria bacterium]